MPQTSREAVVALPGPRVSRWWIAVPLLVAAGVAAQVVTNEVARRLSAPLPEVATLNVHAALFDLTPVAVTITAAAERVPFVTTRDAVLTDVTLWRRMHLADWNGVPTPLRHEGLDRMLASYRHVLNAPRQWDQMTPHHWDRVPQPIRVLAFRHMVEYWSGFYDVGGAHGLPPRVVSDTLAAIVMSESWFDHRAVNVGYGGQRDFGLAQASEYAREHMRRWYETGVVDVLLSDADYFNPWSATRFVAIWMGSLLDAADGDLDYAVRAYHRGLLNAFDERGDAYLAAVERRRDRFIRNLSAPDAWDYVWRSDRALRRQGLLVHSGSMRAKKPPEAYTPPRTRSTSSFEPSFSSTGILCPS